MELCAFGFVWKPCGFCGIACVLPVASQHLNENGGP